MKSVRCTRTHRIREESTKLLVGQQELPGWAKRIEEHQSRVHREMRQRGFRHYVQQPWSEHEIAVLRQAWAERSPRARDRRQVIFAVVRTLGRTPGSVRNRMDIEGMHIRRWFR